MYSLHRLSTILQVEYGGLDMAQDPMENFNHCARHYATNKGKSRTAAGWQLLVRMYVWVLQQYAGSEAHRIHRHLICLSFLWAAFTKGVMDRKRQNKKEQVSPRLNKWGHQVRLRWLFDPEKIRQGIASGEMAINQLGDPLPKMDTIHTWLGELYDQVHKQMITAVIANHWNSEQQEKEIIQHLPTEPATTSTLSEAIYSATSNLGTSVPHQSQRMPTHWPDQAERPGQWGYWRGSIKLQVQCWTIPNHGLHHEGKRGRPKKKKLKPDRSSIQVTASSVFKSMQVQHQFNIQGGSCLKCLLILIIVDFCIALYNQIFHVHLSLPFDFSNSAITVYIWLCILVIE